MKRFALIAAPAFLLGACSFGGSHYGAPHVGQYESAPVHTAPVHSAYGPQYGAVPAAYPAPVGNPCAYGGACASGGYSTVAQVHGGHVPSPHAYGTHAAPHAASHAASHGDYGLRGYSRPAAPRGFSYGTLGAQMYDVDRDLYAVQGRLGYQSAGILGAEMEGSIGVNDEDADIPIDLGIRLGIDWQAAAFARASFPLTERFSAFGRAGYHRTNASSFVSGMDFTFKQDGLAYGAGVEYRLSDRNGLRADYTRYERDGPETYDSASVAYVRRF